jgi:hypothetical protein
MDTCYINDGGEMIDMKQGTKWIKTGVIPDVFSDIQ